MSRNNVYDIASISNIIKKLQYQVSILGQTIDDKKYPLQSLIIEKDWSEEDVDIVDDIFDEWDKRLQKNENFSSGEFEKNFSDRLNVTYQGLKSIILAFYKNDQWINVCEAYVDSFGDSASAEYNSIRNRKRS
jgi:hypothetical protein